MKRKKPPIALVSVLILSLLGLVIAGPGFAFYNKSTADQMAQLQKEAEDRARAAQAEQMKTAKVDSTGELKKLQDNVSTVGTPQARSPMQMSSSDGGKTTKSAVPTVIMPNTDIQKPKPNPTAPVGQWYHK